MYVECVLNDVECVLNASGVRHAHTNRDLRTAASPKRRLCLRRCYHVGGTAVPIGLPSGSQGVPCCPGRVFQARSATQAVPLGLYFAAPLANPRTAARHWDSVL